MRRILIIANTYYQLILAIQLRATLFKQDEVVLFLSDHSNNARSMAKNLEKERYFTQVKYIETKHLRKKTDVGYRIAVCYENLFTKNNRYKRYFEGIDNLYFDEMIIFNVDLLMYSFYAILYEYNHALKFSGYEEGLLSYNVHTLYVRGSKLLCLARNLIGKKGFDGAEGNFYCFFPRLYKGSLQAVQVPLIEPHSEIIPILQHIFEVQEKDLVYPQKYIYFSSVYDFEGEKSIGEFELTRKIADLVGRDHLIVKVHPRDERTVYVQAGIRVDKNSSKPWEVIQLLGDFSDKVFLTATSGSVLAASWLATHPARTFYLYKFCDIDKNKMASISVNNIESLLKEKSMEKTFCNVKIANRLEDIG